MLQQPIRVNPSEETFRIGPLQIRFLITRSDSQSNISLFEMIVPAGQKLMAPPHRNDAYEETLYGIEGELTWTVNGVPIAVGPGQALCIPRGAVHRFDNVGTKDAKQVVAITPAIMGPEYFRDVVQAFSAASGGPTDRATMMDIFRRNGMTIADPPSPTS